MAAGCAVAGAVAGLTGAAASPSSHSGTARPALPWAGHWLRDRGPGGLGFGPAVHESAVVLNRAGTGFITATEDSGTVQSVSGDQLTIKEGVGKVIYRTVTLTIPSGATVSRNLASAKLSALKSGDRVRVVQSSEGTTVFALASSFAPPFRGFRHPGWDGPPPAAQGAPGPAGAPGYGPGALPQTGA